MSDLVSLVRSKAKSNGDRPLFRFLHGVLSYAELDRLSDRVATGLAAEGVSPGDRVACLLSNCPEFATTWFGVLKVGAILVPLNTGLRGELLQYELADAGPKAIILESTLVETYASAAPRDTPPKVWVVGSPTSIPARPGSAAPFGSLTEHTGEPPGFLPNPSTPAAILYTSGTTGRPKGVVLPHRRLVNTPREVGLRAQLDARSVLFTALPLFHCNAQEKTALVALVNDLTAAFDDRFHASTFWATATKFGASHVSLLTTMITILFNQEPTANDTAHGVRIATASGTPSNLWREFEARFGLRVIESYGMTECGCTTLMNPPGAIRVGSVGTPLGFIEAQVVDDHDQPVPTDTSGELVVRPRAPFTIFLEYYRQPSATVDAWRNLWFHTGDLVRRDVDGYYYFLDRKRDVIRRRGENIAPHDVEVVFDRHPAVLESVVVGVPAEVGEEDVKVFVQIRPGASVSPEQLFQFAEDRLPKFMVPRYVEFISAIPKTANQKAMRYQLRGRLTGNEIDRTKLSHPP